MSPREPKSWPCRHCHTTLHTEEDTFDCQAEECLLGEQICADCIFDCADCGGDFCRAHVVERLLDERSAEYRCLSCQAKRGLERAA